MISNLIQSGRRNSREIVIRKVYSDQNYNL